MPRTITVIPKAPKLIQKKRVAAYARVSSGKDAMLHSLSAQVSYYSDLIQKHNDWLHVGVYADEAKTGTKDSRPDFQRLVADCCAGKIDLVITKSISRFARNTMTLLQTVRELKALGVDVFFEEQNIHTQSSDGELMMTILASYAQEESRSASENQKWRVRRNFEEGLPWTGILLGYRLNNGIYEIVPEEAILVRRIFADYLSGMGYTAIANSLNEEGIPSRFGKRWSVSVISKMLSNYTYTGNLLLQKTYSENHITKKKCINNVELPKYHVEETHEAIISLATFLAVLEEKEKRAKRFSKNPVSKKHYPFTGLLICDHCGKHYRRKNTHGGSVWICTTFNSEGKAACPSKQIPEEILTEITAQALNIHFFTEGMLRSKVANILVCNENTLVYRFLDGTESTWEWKDRSRSRGWTDEKKAAARIKELERRKNNA